MRLAITNGAVELDREDFAWAERQSWHLGDTGYVKGYGGPRTTPTRMHRQIMERVLQRPLTATEYVDHINRVKTDNRRSNLRLATKSQNGMNLRSRQNAVSKYKGVGMANDGRSKKWMAYINIDGQRFYIGKYYDESEAAWMYDQWALALHGEFARLNFDYQTCA